MKIQKEILTHELNPVFELGNQKRSSQKESQAFYYDLKWSVKRNSTLLLSDWGQAPLHEAVQIPVPHHAQFSWRPLPRLHLNNLPHYLPHQVWELNDIRGPCCQITAPCGEFALFKIKEPHTVHPQYGVPSPPPFSTHWGPWMAHLSPGISFERISVQ